MYVDFIKRDLFKKKLKNDRYSTSCFAKFLGVSKSSLSEIISHKKVPSDSTLEKFLEKLELNTEEKIIFSRSVKSAKLKSVTDVTHFS